MAGSYNHCRDEDGVSFTFEYIENMDDAHEACEEMYYIINYIRSYLPEQLANTFIQEAINDFYKSKRNGS